MKKMTKVTVVALLLATGSINLSHANGPACYLNQSSLRSIENSSDIHSKNRSDFSYESFRSICLGAISELNLETKLAHDEWKFGKSVYAVNRLFNALKVAAEAVVYDSLDVPPHAATTILHSFRIAQKLKESSSRNLDNANLSLQLEFMMLTELVNMVNWANQNLDNPYYRNIVRNYLSDNFSFTRFIFPDEYLLKVKRLSLKYLNLYSEIQDALVEDSIELDVAHSFSHAAKVTLNQSIYRRNYCGAIAGLDRTMELIEGFQCSGSGINSFRQVDIVRDVIDDLRYEIRNSDRFRCY